jgi:hypothetical protein
LDVAVGVDVLVGVLVRVGSGVQVLVGVHVAGKFCTGRASAPRGVTVGRAVDVALAVAVGISCATNGLAAACERLVKLPSANCIKTRTTIPAMTLINTNSSGLNGFFFGISHKFK